MRANLLLDERIDVADTMFVEMVIWEVPQPVIGCDHFYKYRLAFIVENKCVLRYDNEAGKGDHKHWGRREIPYVFSNLDSLIDAFYDDVVLWRSKRWLIGKEP
jgi:hypothetical protein